MVDDDEAVRSSVKLLLQSFGWKARAFASAKELLEVLPSEKPDCLVLDLNMPVMNGAELQERLVADGVVLPVIIVTGEKYSHLAQRAKASGAREILEKPFREDELKESIERVLS
jgi:FixJ family two-component response regulator